MVTVNSYFDFLLHQATQMVFLNHEMISIIVSALYLGFDSIFIRASAPMLVFSIIGLACVYCNKWSSQKAAFDLAMIPRG